MPQSWLRSCFSLLMFPGLCTGRAGSGRAWKSVSSVPCGAEQVQGSRRGARWGLSGAQGWGKPGRRCQQGHGTASGISRPVAWICFRQNGGIQLFFIFSGMAKADPLSWARAGCSSRGGPRAALGSPNCCSSGPSPARRWLWPLMTLNKCWLATGSSRRKTAP